MKSERTLLESLRRRSAELEKQLVDRDAELASIRASLKFTRVNELQVQAQTYLTEARRLRALLDQSQVCYIIYTLSSSKECV